MQTIYIISSGSFYRPVDTPMGKKGWVGEINFWYAPTFEGERIPNISKVFDTQDEADEYVSKELFRMCHDNSKYIFRDYAYKTKPINIMAEKHD